MKYSVVIPSYNSAATIVPCLQTVTQQDFEEPHEIIVVDSSMDATPDLIRTHFPQVTLMHLPARTEPGTARNIGIQRAQGELLCFIDSDCLARPDWLRRMAEAHQSDYAAVGGSIANGNPASWIGWAGYFAEFREFFPYRPRQCMPNIPTCNISYKRRVFTQYGNFTNLMPDWIAFKHPQQEDLVFNSKLGAQGEKILFDPAIQVAHINMPTVRRFLSHQYRLGRNTSYLLRQFPLDGSWIARSRCLTVLAAPLLPCVKFANTFRVAALSKEYRRRFWLTAPLLLLGLLCWDVGFVRGAFLPEKTPQP